MRVDDNLAALLLDPSARLEFRVPMRWETRPTALRAQIGVHNAHGLPLLLGVQVLTMNPWKLTAYLMIYGQHIRRLDVTIAYVGNWRARDVWTEFVRGEVPDSRLLVPAGQPSLLD